MAMSIGSVTIDTSDLSRSGSGLALSLYDGFFKLDDATLALYPKAAKVSALQAAASSATKMATVLVNYITANAEVTTVISTSDGALQQASAVDTTAPTANRTLSQKGTIA